MRAMVLEQIGRPLVEREVPIPQPVKSQVLLKISACGICRTDLHVVDGELPQPKLPLIPGHQIVGTVSALGVDVKHIQLGERVGMPWLGGSCSHCAYCLASKENLCDAPIFTGYQMNGGFAEYCVADARFCFPLPQAYSDVHAAPLLCAGLIGYRALTMTAGAKKIGLFGFGAAAHILTQVINYQGGEVFAFTKPGDQTTQKFAKDLGASWAGSAQERPPTLLDAAIIFAPDGNLVPIALQAVKKGGVVVCGGIHMSDIPSFPYQYLWGERKLVSVANLTRQDGEALLALAPLIPIRTEITTYTLTQTNQALEDLRHGRFSGAAVIVI